MNITIIGATGMVGSRLVTEATTRGHHAVAARHPDREPDTDTVIPLTLDVDDAPAPVAAMANADTAISAIRPAAGREDLAYGTPGNSV